MNNKSKQTFRKFLSRDEIILNSVLLNPAVLGFMVGIFSSKYMFNLINKDWILSISSYQHLSSNQIDKSQMSSINSNKPSQKL